MSNLVNLAASFLRYHVEKETDKRKATEKPTPATTVGVGNYYLVATRMDNAPPSSRTYPSNADCLRIKGNNIITVLCGIYTA